MLTNALGLERKFFFFFFFLARRTTVFSAYDGNFGMDYGRLTSTLLYSENLAVFKNRHASETWMWNAVQQSRIQAVEMSYIRGACGVSRWDGESNENTYGRFGISETAVEMDCRVVEWVK